MRSFYLAVLFSVAMLVVVNTSFATLSLTVNNPLTTNYSYPATIQDMFITASPQGTFLEIGMYLIFSPRGSYYTKQKDTVEIVFTFDLPKEAIVNDSWLWMDDGSIVKAILIDKWKASQIYEGIVKRRRDPSILTKTSATSYEIRIFPCAGNSTRKIKINYMVPMSINSSSMSASLPFNFLSSSYAAPNTVKFMALTNSEFKSPVFPDAPKTEMTKTLYQDTIEAYSIDLPAAKTGHPQLLSYTSPVKNGLYFSSLPHNDEKFYQLAFNTSQLADLNTPKKVMVLLDYDELKSTNKWNDILGAIKTAFLNNFTLKDSINLIKTSFSLQPYSKSWIQASSANINTMIDDLSKGTYSSYSNVVSLLGNGLEYLYSNNDTNAIVLLISDSDYLGNVNVSNDVLTQLQLKLNPKTRIFIADYCNLNQVRYVIANRTYYGNEYLYYTIANLSKGNYLGMVTKGLSIQNLMQNITSCMNSDLQSLDYYLTFDNGFSYAKYDVAGSSLNPGSNYTIQTGKFTGDLPGEILVTGFSNNKPIMKKVPLTKEITSVDYPATRTIWTASYIKYLEGKNQTNEIASEIVKQSMENRILSFYTAFLALERPPSDSIGQEEKKELTETPEEIAVKEIRIEANPNPLSSNSHITISFPDNFEFNNLKIEIFDILGKKVKTLTHNYDGSGNFSFDWTGNDDTGKLLSNGTYLLVISSGTIKIPYKLIIAR